jgi:peptide subunit release factor RF-3
MDPNHRDRMAFMRVCSGRLTRGMRAKLMRTGKLISINTPQFFFAQERALAEEAVAGDVVGIPNHGTLRIGDTLTDGETLAFRGVPSFAPEILRSRPRRCTPPCSRWPRRAWSRCSRRSMAARRSSAWSAPCSSTC